MSALHIDDLMKEMVEKDRSYLIPYYVKLTNPVVSPDMYVDMILFMREHCKKYKLVLLCEEALRLYPTHEPLREILKSLGVDKVTFPKFGKDLALFDEDQFLSHIDIALKKIKNTYSFLNISQVNIDIVTGCNYCCYHCYFAKYLWPTAKKPIFVPFDDIKYKIKSLARLIRALQTATSTLYNRKNIILNFGGVGEPLLHPDYEKIIEYADSWGFGVKCITNGALLSGRKAKALVNAKIDNIQVSIDAFSEDLYAKFRKGGNLKKVIRNIDSFLALCAAQNHKVKFSVTMCHTSENTHEVKDFLSYWAPKTDTICVQRFQEVDALEQARAAADAKAFVRTQPCLNLGHTLQFSADGSVSSCMCGDLCIGNLNDAPLEEIFTSIERIKWFVLNEQNIFSEMPEACQSCSNWGARQTLKKGILAIEGNAYSVISRSDGIHIANTLHTSVFTCDTIVFPEIPSAVQRNIDSFNAGKMESSYALSDE